MNIWETAYANLSPHVQLQLQEVLQHKALQLLCEAAVAANLSNLQFVDPDTVDTELAATIRLLRAERDNVQSLIALIQANTNLEKEPQHDDAYGTYDPGDTAGSG